MRKALTVALGMAVLTATIYARLVMSKPSAVVHIARRGASATHSPVLIARATDAGVLIAQATDAGGAWTLRSDELTLPESTTRPIPEAYLAALEALLSERAIATDSEEERTQIVHLIRATRAYRRAADHVSAQQTSALAKTESAPRDAVVNLAPTSSSSSSPSEPDSSNKHRGLNINKPVNILAPIDRLVVLPETDLLSRVRADLRSRDTKILQAILWAAGYLLIIICGIYTGALYDALGSVDPQKPLKLRQILRKAATAGAWQGLLASPIVFAVVMFVVPQGHFSFAMGFFAYQNGFFWRTTLQKFAQTRRVAQV